MTYTAVAPGWLSDPLIKLGMPVRESVANIDYSYVTDEYLAQLMNDDPVRTLRVRCVSKLCVSSKMTARFRRRRRSW